MASLHPLTGGPPAGPTHLRPKSVPLRRASATAIGPPVCLARSLAPGYAGRVIGPAARLPVRGLWTAFLAACLQACAPSPAVVRILEVNDLHVLDEESTVYPDRIVEAMNAEGADLVLVCGDLATNGREEELRLARRVLDRLKIPYHAVLGNHDAPATGRPDEVFRRFFPQSGTTYAFERRGIHFVAIDPECGKNYTENRVPPPVLEKLREIAAAIPAGRPVILFSHYPYGPGVTYRTPNAEEVLGLFREKDLLAVVSGHWHGNTEKRADGVLFTTTACASSTRSNHDKTEARGYRTFTVREGREIDTRFRRVPLVGSRTLRVGPGGDEGYREATGLSIQKAVDALRESGGTVVITAGDYRVSRAIRLDRSRRLHVQGEGRVLLRLEPAPVAALAQAAPKGSREIVLREAAGLYVGAELEAIKAPWPGSPPLRVAEVGPAGRVRLGAALPADLPEGASMLVVENLLQLTEVQDVSLSGLEMDLQRDLQPFAPVNHTRHCGVYVGGPYNHALGTSSPSRRVRIADCTVRRAHHRGFALYAVEEADLLRCRVEDVGAEGVDLDHFCRRIHVEECRVRDAGMSGIEINDGADCTVICNVIERCKVGIKVWHYPPCTMAGANRGNRLAGNEIRDSGTAGIWMGREVDGNAVEENLVTGVRHGPGIHLEGRGNTLRANTIRDAARGALEDRGEGNDVRP